ncbi:MAG: hypothetical protein HQL54_00770 [Magnetococcales bacterium]|nr:hypothetical protein [Magnetococcales bacterium]
MQRIADDLKTFIIGLLWATLALVTNSVCAAPQSTTQLPQKHLVLVQSMPVIPVLNHTKAFLYHLEEMGYVDGKNLTITLLQPNGDRARTRTMLEKVLNTQPVDIVVTSATMASQVCHELLLQNRSIPQIFFTVSDPVGAKIVPNLGRVDVQGITGKVHSADRKTKIRVVLKILDRDNHNRPIRFGFIHTSYPSAKGDAALLKEAAKAFDNVTFITREIPYRPIPAELPALLVETHQYIIELEDQVDYWWHPSGPLGERPEFLRQFRQHSSHTVAYGTNFEIVHMGALIHITPSDDATGKEAAIMAFAILNGTSPNQFPIVPPKEIDLGLNIAAIRNLGFLPPSDLLELAGPNLFLDIHQ